MFVRELAFKFPKYGVKNGKVIWNINLVLQDPLNSAVETQDDHWKVFGFVISQNPIQLFSKGIQFFPIFFQFRLNRYLSVTAMDSLADIQQSQPSLPVDRKAKE